MDGLGSLLVVPSISHGMFPRLALQTANFFCEHANPCKRRTRGAFGIAVQLVNTQICSKLCTIPISGIQFNQALDLPCIAKRSMDINHPNSINCHIRSVIRLLSDALEQPVVITSVIVQAQTASLHRSRRANILPVRTTCRTFDSPCCLSEATNVRTLDSPKEPGTVRSGISVRISSVKRTVEVIAPAS